MCRLRHTSLPDRTSFLPSITPASFFLLSPISPLPGRRNSISRTYLRIPNGTLTTCLELLSPLFLANRLSKIRCFIFYNPFTGPAPFLHCLPATAQPPLSSPLDPACLSPYSLFMAKSHNSLWLRLKAKIQMRIGEHLQSKTFWTRELHPPHLFCTPV